MDLGKSPQFFPAERLMAWVHPALSLCGGEVEITQPLPAASRALNDSLGFSANLFFFFFLIFFIII